MKLTRLTVDNFTMFPKATFDFAPGVNVLVGENGTGKSHVLKLAYIVNRASREHGRRQGSLRVEPKEDMAAWLGTELREVFQPDSLQSFSRTTSGCSISAEWGAAASLEIHIDAAGGIGAKLVGNHSDAGTALFVPAREVLSIYPGFVAAWLNRESSFDRTYFDVCSALGLRPLRDGAISEPLKQLAVRLEAAIQGTVAVRNDRFYIEYGGGPMEVSMVGEGDRKMAMLAHLLRNGTLAEGGLLVWDEPEASLNPKRALLMSDAGFLLARAGVQVLLSTHDYALCSEIALKAGDNASGDVAFFGMNASRGSAEVERSVSFLGLKENPILDAFSGIHDREELAMLEQERAS